MTCCDTQLTTGQYHCSACCNTFGSLSLFDHHQDVNYGPPARLVCRNPLRMRGLVLHSGVWRTRTERDALVVKLEKMAQGRKEAL